MDTQWQHDHINIPRDVNSEADHTADDHTVTCLSCRKKKNILLQGYMIDSLRFERLLKELPVPIIMMTWHLVYSEAEEHIILTITVLLGDESLLPHCFVTIAFGPQGCPYTQWPWFPLFRCITHLIPLLFVTHYFQLSRGKKKVHK